jgi:predicted DNA-binding helix-hairpin-helix protein
MSFTPAEYANTFMKLYTMNVTEGVFLSSAVCGDADRTTREMIETVRLLRFTHKFMGYIHFKILPGTSYSLIKEAMQYADRISVNVEAPTKGHLADIAEQKDYDNDILLRQRWIKELRHHHNAEARKALQDYEEDYPNRCGIIQNTKKDDSIQNGPLARNPRKRKEWLDEFGVMRRQNGYQKIRWDDAPILTSGQTTQFILGAAGEADWDVLKRLDWEYREMDLRRGYFSAFSPIKGSPLGDRPATPLDREHRLYQTDWLLRQYHFELKEVKEILTENDNLPMGDPKIHLARAYFGIDGAIDINEASYEELLRIPGVGPLSAQRILDLRQHHEYITSRRQLHEMGVVLKRADPYINVNGHKQSRLDMFV